MHCLPTTLDGYVLGIVSLRRYVPNAEEYYSTVPDRDVMEFPGSA
jgi:hypothetical protein